MDGEEKEEGKAATATRLSCQSADGQTEVDGTELIRLSGRQWWYRVLLDVGHSGAKSRQGRGCGRSCGRSRSRVGR